MPLRVYRQVGSLGKVLSQQTIGVLVRNNPQLELMNDVQLNIVAFRYNPGGLGDEQLNEPNHRLSEVVLADGRFLVGTSKIGTRTVFRPAFSNWRTRFADVEEFAEVILDVAKNLM